MNPREYERLQQDHEQRVRAHLIERRARRGQPVGTLRGRLALALRHLADVVDTRPLPSSPAHPS